jgi:hypothetical protein
MSEFRQRATGAPRIITGLQALSPMHERGTS